jgi:hypothetical protein
LTNPPNQIKPIKIDARPQTHWDEERARHPEDPKLWRALAKAFFPMQLPMFLPFLVVTAAKIVQAHVGVKGLIEALDANRPAKDVRACVRAWIG